MKTLKNIFNFITNYKGVFLIDIILIGIVAVLAIFGLIDKYDTLVQWCVGGSLFFIGLLLLRKLITFVIYKMYGDSN